MKVIDVEQGTEKWLKWRNRKPSQLSASIAPTINGECEYETEHELWVRRMCTALPESEVPAFLRLHGVKPEQDFDRNPHVRRGKKYEDPARQAYEVESGNIGGLPLCIESTEYPWLQASLDFFLNGHVVEIKVPCESNFLDVQKRGTQSALYKRYRGQVKAQMITATENGKPATGELVFYSVEQKKLIRFTIRLSPTSIKKQIAKLKWFHDLLEAGKPPEKDPLKDTYVPSGNEIDIWRPHCESIVDIDNELTLLEARVKELKELRKKDGEVLSDQVEEAGFKRGSFMGVNITRYTVQGTVQFNQIVDERLDMLDCELDLYRKAAREQTRITTSS